MFLTSPLIDQAIAQVCAVYSPICKEIAGSFNDFLRIGTLLEAQAHRAVAHTQLRRNLPKACSLRAQVQYFVDNPTGTPGCFASGRMKNISFVYGIGLNLRHEESGTWLHRGSGLSLGFC